jgi:hypothetical protein
VNFFNIGLAVKLFSTLFIVSFLVIFWTGIVSGRPPPPLPAPSEHADPFMAFELGVGGDQHYPASARRYFTNVVAVAVNDLDGDGFQDIVMMANSIPQNGAYSASGPTQDYNYSHYCYGESVFKPPLGTYWVGQGEYLNPGDMLYNAAATLGPLFNPADSSPNWFTPEGMTALRRADRTTTVHYAPPSANIVAGLISTPPYVGSDLAWLQGDGRGNFTFRFITAPDAGGVDEAPIRIRMGTQIRLRKLSESPVLGLDIVLISENENRLNMYQPQNSTSLEIFTGASRVMWLENRGWDGPRLTFRDHGIAEYNNDRMPVIFYGAHADYWEGPYASLNPTGVAVLNIDTDGREDILVGNRIQGLHGSADITYDGTNPSPASLDAWYSSALPRPRDGDRWVANEAIGSPVVGTIKTLFWYENTLAGGNTQFSTSTFHTAFLGVIGSTFTFVYDEMVPMALAGGVEAIACMRYNDRTSPVYLRIHGTAAEQEELVLSRAPTEIPKVKNNKKGRTLVADIDRDGDDELISVRFDCIGGCYEKIDIFSITPNAGNTDVTISREYTFTLDNAWVPYGNMVIADMNGDGSPDFFVPNESGHDGYPNHYAATLLLNLTPPGGTISFLPLAQKRPLLFQSQKITDHYAQVGFGDIGHISPKVSVAFGDFNEDGFIDFVRVGPKLPVTLFINNFSGLQRARVTASVEHRTGTTKTWNVIYGADIAPGGATTINSNQAGGIGVQGASPE